MKVVATTRKEQGSSASRRLRRSHQVPGIIYGGSNEPTPIAIEHNPLYHALRVETFHSSILDMELDGQPEQVLLRDIQWHPYRQQVMHIDFQRVSADRPIHMRVPLHFRNQEASPAVKQSGGIVGRFVDAQSGRQAIQRFAHVFARFLEPALCCQTFYVGFNAKTHDIFLLV